MARRDKPVRVERGLYRAGRTFLACATPRGSRVVRWKTIGEVGLMEARAERDAWATHVRGGGVPVLERATVEAAARVWLEHVQGRVEAGELRPRTLESYANGINLHVLPHLGRRQISSLTADDLVAWLRAQRKAGASRWTIRARWMALRGLLAYATRYGWITANPADQLLAEERPKSGENHHRYLSRDEMSRLMAHGKDTVLVACGLFTGMRASEILGLTWGDVDFDAGEINVRHQMSRQGKRMPLKTRAAHRAVVLMPALAGVLRRHRLASPRSGDGELVFQSSTGATMGYWSLQDRFNAAASAAGLEGVTFHTLRHTFASILISQGRDVEFVARQLGHAQTSTTLDVYSHLFDARRHAEQARDVLEADFGQILAGTKQELSA